MGAAQGGVFQKRKEMAVQTGMSGVGEGGLQGGGTTGRERWHAVKTACTFS